MDLFALYTPAAPTPRALDGELERLLEDRISWAPIIPHSAPLNGSPKLQTEIELEGRRKSWDGGCLPGEGSAAAAVRNGGCTGGVCEFAHGDGPKKELRISLQVIHSGEQVDIPIAPSLGGLHEDLNLHDGNSNSCNVIISRHEHVPGPALDDTRITVMDVPLINTLNMGEPSAQNTRESTEEEKHALKVAYCSIGLSGAGLVSIICGFAQGQIGHTHTLSLKICTVLLLVAFTSAACLIRMAGPRRNRHYDPKTIMVFEYTTLGSLILAMISLSFMFLKLVILAAVLPVLVILLLAFCLRSH